MEGVCEQAEDGPAMFRRIGDMGMFVLSQCAELEGSVEFVRVAVGSNDGWVGPVELRGHVCVE